MTNVIQLNPKRKRPLTADPAAMPRSISELSPPLEVLQSHLFADLDAYADRFDRRTIEDMFERWRKQA